MQNAVQAPRSAGDEEAVAPPHAAFPAGPVARREVPTPAGVIELVATPAGLAVARWGAAGEALMSSIPDDDRGDHLATAHLDQAEAELAGYFDGHAYPFEVDIDLGGLRGFAREVLMAARRVPFGRLATYSEVAAHAGSPVAARAAGNALAANPLCVIVPCHRIVPRHGGLGGYAGGMAVKEWLLRLEGITLR